MVKAVIIAVRKDDNGVITHVKSQVWIDDKRKPDQELQKFMMIQNIKVFHWECSVQDGTKVHIVDGRYLRTDGNDTKEDNLGELPTF